jgi:hypothetical protein
MATIGETVGDGTEGSVLFVDSATKLAQDNAGFYFDQDSNALKTANAGSGAASENFTVSTGVGGAGNLGAPPAGNSGDLLLKTGAGGSDPFGTAGSGGNVIIQPGTSGGGSGGSGGSTLVRAPANAPGSFFAIQSDTGANTYWSVTHAGTAGMLTGTRPLSIIHDSALTPNTLFVNGSGVKSASFTALIVGSTATSSAAGVTKTAMSVNSIGVWNGAGSISRALHTKATGGAKNYAAIFEAGNVGVNELNPSARLHIGGGTTAAGTAPLKLTAGALTTVAEDGAIEWDGSRLWITSGTLRKELTNANIVDVTDFGAVGDGTTDDGPAFKAAVDALIDTGGAIYVPPDRCYAIATEVEIRSYYPIYFVSTMQNPAGFYSTEKPHQTGYIRPTDTFNNGMFRWLEPNTEAAWSIYNGGGGMIGIAIADVHPTTTANRTNSITNGAVYMRNALTFKLERCNFWYLKGSAVRTNQCVNGEIIDCISQRCGNKTGTPPNEELHPAFHFGDDTHFNGLYIDGLFSQVQYDAPHMQTETNAGVNLRDCYFENDSAAQNPVPSQKFVVGSGSFFDCTFNYSAVQKLELNGDSNLVSGCSFASGPTSDVPTITMSGQYSRILNCKIDSSASQAGNCVLMSGAGSMIADTIITGGGNLAMTGLAPSVVSVTVWNCQTTQDPHATRGAVIKVTNGRSRVVGNLVYTCPNTGVKGIEVTAEYTTVIGNVVSDLTNANGIDTSAIAYAAVVGNQVFSVGMGTPVATNAASTEGFNHDQYKSFGSFTIDPPSIAGGGSWTSGDFALAGAELGDIISYGNGVSLQELICCAYVASAGNVRINLYNPTAEAIDLGDPSTWYFRVHK